MTRYLTFVYPVFTLFLLGAIPQAQANFYEMVRRQEIVNHGKDAYLRHCSGCHGEKGDGAGPAAVFLNPRPRDFTKGIYKFRSTPVGSLPTDEDLMRTISYGVAGTSMPGFIFVPEIERRAIIEYIKTFFGEWKQKEKTSESPVVGAPYIKEDFLNYKKFISRAQKGQNIFNEACLTCHGNQGQGDGPGAVDLQDDWGQPIKPAHLGKITIKSGQSVKDIYRTLLTGLDGTPMPSFKGSYSDEELWDVAAYVLYLRGLHQGKYDKSNPPLSPITE